MLNSELTKNDSSNLKKMPLEVLDFDTTNPEEAQALSKVISAQVHVESNVVKSNSIAISVLSNKYVCDILSKRSPQILDDLANELLNQSKIQTKAAENKLLESKIDTKMLIFGQSIGACVILISVLVGSFLAITGRNTELGISLILGALASPILTGIVDIIGERRKRK